MQYENPEVPEGINVSREHPLREFTVLVGGSLAVVVTLVLLLGWLAGAIATRIPFSFEQEIAGGFDADTTEDGAHAAIEAALQRLADALVAEMDLPAEMRIRTHYIDDAGTVNAFAALGGHVVVFRGLLERMPHENALAMVLAHEIAHIEHRDPITSLGRGVVLGLALAAITGVSGSDLPGSLLGTAGNLTALRFSRDQEQAADATALATVAIRYGHVQGAAAVFELFEQMEAEHPLHPPEFLSSHPGSSRRLEALASLARRQGWPETGGVTPLSAVLALEE